MSVTERKTLSLKSDTNQKYLSEIDHLRQQLAEAKRELAAWQRKSRTDNDLSVLRPQAFRSALTEARTERRVADGPGCFARVTLTSLPDILTTHGGEAAETALTHVAQLLSGHVRFTDQVGRMGVGTFGVLLAFAQLEDTTDKMQRLKAKIEGAQCEHEGVRLPITLALTMESL
ncbi:GGDEF domain-containing protein [Parvularcula sp. LCG005]|uniref:GGDEF domain-containing protein n=1 Tax=Parvularcula sp. LCG005 TaxID=3078805 RepID=UPI002941C16F|nr:GGDEF domain-containing protein [Parvularcula sp. LCG005]WOI53953.1 GGDEF domain-containing protein [Parvularcula sp. LCG005]